MIQTDVKGKVKNCSFHVSLDGLVDLSRIGESKTMQEAASADLIKGSFFRLRGRCNAQ